MKAPRSVLGILPVALVAALAFLIVPGLVHSTEVASAKPKFTLIYYDGHMHTTRSDGSGSVVDIKATALSRGLGVVVVTDHCKSLTLEEWNSLVAETEAASDASFLALPGFEVTGSDGMFNRDHFLAYNVADPFVGDDAAELCPEEVWESPPNPAGTGPMYPENLTKWADYIHSRGGIAVHNHTSGTTQLGYGVNSIEIYNQSHVDDVAAYAKLLGFSDREAWELGITLNNFAIYGERDVNMLVDFPGFPTPIPLRIALYVATKIFSGVGQLLGSPQAPLSSWDDLLTAYVDGTVDMPNFGVANSDAHNTGDAGSKVGAAKNGLYVKELTADEFYKAIKAGRSFATTGPSLAFDVNGELMGDTAELASGGTANLNLSVNAMTPGYILYEIRIMKNEVILQTVSPFSPAYQLSLADTVTEDGYYRVEVVSVPEPGVEGLPQFAYSNPVFVNVP